MAKRENISICIDDLFAASKQGHPAIEESRNGKKYAQVSVWFNEQPNEWGKDISVQLYDKEAGTVYIGQGKSQKLWAQNNQSGAANNTTPQPTSEGIGANISDDDLPF